METYQATQHFNDYNYARQTINVIPKFGLQSKLIIDDTFAAAKYNDVALNNQNKCFRLGTDSWYDV